MIHPRQLFVLTAIACFSIIGDAQTEPFHIEIASPSKGTAVPYRPCISGTVSATTAAVFAVVHPLEVATYYVQSPMTPDNHGKFLGKLYIATEQRQLFENQKFEVRLFANPKVSLREGQELGYWPASEAMSDVIVVTRIDDASDGCEAASGIALDEQRVFLRPSTALFPGTLQGDFSSLIERSRPLLGAGFVFLFFLFAVHLTRANHVLTLLHGGYMSFKAIMKEVFNWVFASIPGLYQHLKTRCVHASAAVWQARGTSLTLRAYWLRVIVCVVLLFAVPLAGGAEAFVLHSRLPLILKLAPGPSYGLFDSEDLPSPTQSAQHGWINWLISHSGQFVEHEALWLIAIGLVVFQIIGGVFLFWDFAGAQALETSPWALLRKRWIAFPAFCGLNVALSWLAALGGMEFSPDRIGLVPPALIAATVALALPWFGALALYYAVENAADCLGPATASIVVAAVFTASGLILGAWTGLSVAAVTLAMCIFLMACTVGGVIAVVVWIAVVFGEAVRKIYNRIFPDRVGGLQKQERHWPAPVTAATTAIAISIVSVVVYVLMAK